MAGQKKSPFSLTIEDLTQELMARSTQVPTDTLFQFADDEGTTSRNTIMKDIKEKHGSSPTHNPNLADIGTWDLAKILVFKTRPGLDSTRGNASEDILDYFEISDPHTLYNSQSIATLCLKDDLMDNSQGQVTLKSKNYGKTFNLCELEPFRDQPIATHTMATAFLVAEDIIATATQHLKNNPLSDLSVLFGYTMTDISSPTLTFPKENIYHGVEIIQQDENPDGGWALIKLDRPVIDFKKAKLSADPIFFDEEIYVIGHPLGLPLKYAAGASVTETQTTHFYANLPVYAAHIGSPVFDLHSHQVIGMVVDTDTPHFIWTGNGWLSLDSPDSKKILCARIPEFIHHPVLSNSDTHR